MDNMPVSTKSLKWFPGMRTFLCATLVLWTIVGVVAFVAGHIRHRPELFWFPLFSRTAVYNDFEIFRDQFRFFGTPQFWAPGPPAYAYPAADSLVIKAFLSVPAHQLLFFRLFIVLAVVVGAVWSARALVRRGLRLSSSVLFVGVSVIASYPFMFLIERANIEIVNWIFASLAIAALWRERWKLAGLLLGIAISLKLFPVLLLGIFLARKKFLAILIAIATAGIFDITALAILGPTIKLANQHLSATLQTFGKAYVFGYHYWEIPFDHSLLAVFKHLAQHTYTNDTARFARFAHGYMVAAALGGLLLYFARIIRLPRVNQIVILLSLALLLPPISGDYTLIHLYAGWLVLALFALEAEPGIIRSRVLPACFLLLAIIFCPETWMFIGQAHIAGSFKALALSVLVLLLLVYRLEEKPKPTEEDVCNEYTDKQAGSVRRAPLFRINS
jgi:hypothetical protein